MSRAELLENMDAEKAPSVYIKIESSQHSQEILAKIKRILLEHKGKQVFISIMKGKNRRLSFLSRFISMRITRCYIA